VVRRVIGQGVDLEASWALCVRDTSAVVMVVVVSWLGWHAGHNGFVCLRGSLSMRVHRLDCRGSGGSRGSRGMAEQRRGFRGSRAICSA
jgi:hypothetical protein